MGNLRKVEEKRRELSNCIMSPVLPPVLNSPSAVTIYFVPINPPGNASGFSSPGLGRNDGEGQLSRSSWSSDSSDDQRHPLIFSVPFSSFSTGIPSA